MNHPIDAVRQPDPYPYYASLVAERPFAFDDELRLWVASDAAAVSAVLADPDLRVRPLAEPVPTGIVGTPAGAVFGSLVRMTDGPVHQRLKHVVAEALGRVDREQVRKLAAERAGRSLRVTTAPAFDELMFAVPAQVVATLCGLDDGVSEEAVPLVGDFVRCLPASATPAEQAAAAGAARRLLEMMGPALDESGGGLLGDLARAARGADWHDAAPLVANGIGLLSQTWDATAGLIGNTLVALARSPGARPSDLDRYVAEVTRHDAPVHNTRRFTALPFRHGGALVEPGQAILVLLAAANRDPAVNPDPHEFRMDRTDPAVFTFGAAEHGCPGRLLAETIAATVVGELLRHGWDPATLPTRLEYRPLANVRIPMLQPSPGGQATTR